MNTKIFKRTLVGIILLQITISGCDKKNDINLNEYKKEIEQWREKRVERLLRDDGWLTLCGLFWLNEGENKFGTDSSNSIIFAPDKSPKYSGSIFLKKGELRLKTAKGVEIKIKDSLVTDAKLKSDENGKSQPTIMNLKTLIFYVIERDGRLGVRVKDKENPARMNFTGLEYFPINPKWRIDARFDTYAPPKVIPIVNVLGKVKNDTCTGAIVFKVDGELFRLDALREGKELFIIFHDETSGNETYGMGRFLYTDLPDSNNNVVIDFNKAYNPPCAFTEFAVCPTPPEQNYLKLRIEAGEKKYAGSEH